MKSQLTIARINNRFFIPLQDDKELLFNKNGRRPYAIIVKLKFNHQIIDFAIPFRSNISPKTPKQQYFSLPPNKKTKPYHKHGLHYVKMFPIKRQFLEKFDFSDPYYQRILKIIDNNHKKIITNAQKYVVLYENHKQSEMTPNWQQIINIYFK